MFSIHTFYVVYIEESIWLHQCRAGKEHMKGTSCSLHQTAASAALLLSNPLTQTLAVDSSTLCLVVTPLFVSLSEPSRTESHVLYLALEYIMSLHH